jgi:hypothetical protein
VDQCFLFDIPFYKKIVFAVHLQYTGADYLFGIFKLFFFTFIADIPVDRNKYLCITSKNNNPFGQMFSGC